MSRTLVTYGPFLKARCGVVDYTRRLLAEASLRPVELVEPTSYRALAEQAPCCLHFQYPSLYFGHSLWHAMNLALANQRGTSTLMTLHEFSLAFWLRKLVDLALVASVDHVIVTNRTELDSLRRLTGTSRHKFSVIPIGSNIPAGHAQGTRSGIVYFGLLGDKPGLRRFLRLHELAGPDFRHEFSICGAVIPGAEREVETLVKRYSGIRWHFDRRDDQIAQILSQTQYAYLPYPDGASDRRGSLLACLLNGVSVITNCTQATPGVLREAVLSADTEQEALQHLKSGVQVPPDALRRANERYDWAMIAGQHAALYQLAGRATVL